MNWNKSFRRKVVYIALMAVLLVPLSLISRPAIPGSKTTAANPGGVLAQKRSQYNLSQAELGEIDPASETMKLALLGMRGVAANILWTKANHYKKTEQWPKLMATVEQITNLQPNFISVWQFQAWNVSYNVSVEFDNYLHRYFWVKRGIRFLIDGTRYNRDEPRLLWDIGWFFGQKLGRADEYKQFRREFRQDDEFHEFLRPYIGDLDWDNECVIPSPYNRPDNWLVSRQWFLQAQDSVVSGRATLRGRALQSIFDEKPSERKKGKSPVLFYSNPAMSLISFAAAIQEEGFFDEVARNAWAKAARNWTDYGNREIRTSRDFYIRLNEAEQLEAEVAELREEFDQLLSGAEQKLLEEKRAKLSADELLALETPAADRSSDQMQMARQAGNKLVVNPMEMTEVADDAIKDQARWQATEIMDKKQRADFVRRYRQIVNFNYWRTRCEVEQLEEANTARKHLYQADADLGEARLLDAKKNYELAWDAWAQIYEQYPSLRADVGAEDVVDAVKRYAYLLGQLDESFPTDFKLKELVQVHDRNFRPWGEVDDSERGPQEVTSPPAVAPVDETPADDEEEEAANGQSKNASDGNNADTDSENSETEQSVEVES